MYEKVKKLMDEKKNLFITGPGGCGKSYILHKLCEEYNIEVTSTTGISALNVGGQTIHSWAGMGIGKMTAENVFLKLKKQAGAAGYLQMESTLSRIRDTKILAIDEISMLDGKLFTLLDELLKLCKGNKNPFGGIQVLIFGDFFQLPPVDIKNKYAFDTESWKEAEIYPVLLEKVYRQNDIKFINCLNNARIGKLSALDISLLETREIMIADCPENTVLHIFGKNDQADAYNFKKLNEIGNPSFYFEAEDSTKDEQDLDKLNKYCKAPKTLELKVGARVMHLKNDRGNDLVNGQMGTITELYPELIRVEFESGVKEINRTEFECVVKKMVYDPSLGQSVEKKETITREQFPLRLAYGITIHKSQGMSLDTVRVNLNNIFSAGQAYVALSRARTLEGLYLVGFEKKKIFADERIVKFYEELRSPIPQAVVQQSLFNVIEENAAIAPEATAPSAPDKDKFNFFLEQALAKTTPASEAPKIKTVFDILEEQHQEVEESIKTEPMPENISFEFEGVQHDYTEGKWETAPAEARPFPRYSFTQEEGFKPANELAEKAEANKTELYFDAFDKTGYIGNDLIGEESLPF